MESSSQNDSNATQEVVETTQDKSAPKSTRPQKPLLLFAVLGLSFAGWYGWNHRAQIVAVCLNKPLNHRKMVTLQQAEFNSEGLLLPKEEVMSGGVPKDGIPALTEPEFVSVSEATYMKPADRLGGVVFEGEARAYPLKIMDMHEVVNDRIGETAFALTYCPLCDSLAVYDRKGKAGDLEFGVSGFLFNSNVLLYDRTGSGKTDGLWSQMMSQAVSGPRVEEKLILMPVELTTWEDWKARYPETKVLSMNTGYGRNYLERAYEPYFSTDDLMFAITNLDERLPNKTPLLGISAGGKKRAYPVTAFEHLTEPQEFEQELAGKKFTLAYNPKAKSLRIVKADPDLNWLYSFWFAWYAFNPDTELYADSSLDEPGEGGLKQPADAPIQAVKPK